MNNFTTDSKTERTNSGSRWIVSHVTSSHPDFGPDLIAVRIDARTVELLREFLFSLHQIVVRGSAMARLQWLGAHVEFLREQDIGAELGSALDGLSEEAAFILPPGADLPPSCLNGYDIRTECEAFTMLRVGERFDSEVFASARIKHTGIEIESKHDLWPIIGAAFPASHAFKDA